MIEERGQLHDHGRIKIWSLRDKDGGYICIHRDNGPAVIQTDYQAWYQHGKIHRVDGPAQVYGDGTQYWQQHGKFHREDGPAILGADGCKQWWIRGEILDCRTQEEFERLMRLKSFW